MIILAEITWVDKINAIAAIIAILGGIAGLITLFIKDKGKQKQINELANQTAELAKQADEAQKQTFEMEKSNRILQRQLELQENVLSKQIDLGEQEEKREQQKRAEEIKPFLRKYRGGSRIRNTCTITLKNFGGRAKEAELMDDSEEGIHVKIENFNYRIEENQDLKVKITGTESKPRIKYNFRINMKDADDNKYFQRIHGKGLDYEVDDPEKL